MEGSYAYELETALKKSMKIRNSGVAGFKDEAIDYYDIGVLFSDVRNYLSSVVNYEEIVLADRTWVCYNCSTELDRDVNAAMNICNKGIEDLSGKRPDYSDGATVRLSSIEQVTVKS